MRHRYVAEATVAGLVTAYILVARPRHLRWGASTQERNASLPGDDLIESPDLTATRAITVRAPAGRVWPWIVQLGQGRGGFYSYDFLENLVGCDIHSADRVVPEWQDIKIGDEVRLAPPVALDVAALEPGRSLVLRGGVPMGNTPAPYDFTWAWVLRDEPDGTSRLLVRERYAYTRPWARFLVEPAEAISFVMSQKMLRGIRDRVEQPARGPGPGSPETSALPRASSAAWRPFSAGARRATMARTSPSLPFRSRSCSLSIRIMPVPLALELAKSYALVN